MISRLKGVTEGRSAREVIGLVGKYLVYLIRQLTPQARRARTRERAFDQKWGTDTTRRHSLSLLQVDRELARHGVQYQASDGDQLLMLLDRLAIPFSDYSFIDFGSGKGRIVLMASFRPFREVYGVEFSPELVLVAKQNLKVVRGRVASMAPVQWVCSNAGTFDPPPGNLVCYFYNPFDKQIMSQVVSKLEAALDTNACDIRVIYVNPVCRDVFEVSGRWTQEVVVDNSLIAARHRADPPLVLSARSQA